MFSAIYIFLCVYVVIFLDDLHPKKNIFSFLCLHLYFL